MVTIIFCFLFSLWLNECFAHYMQYFGISHVLDNNLDVLDEIVLNALHSGLMAGGEGYMLSLR